MRKTQCALALTAACALGAYAVVAQDQQPSEDMTFFVTSSNPGNGGDLGGLSGADQHCQALAEAVGAGHRTWRAYLSTTEENARDRIGEGPWHNHEGQVIAQNLDDLHFNNVNLNRENILTEQGNRVNGIGEQPLQHDIMTGSNADGTAHELTCNDWTDSSADAQTMLGHHDRIGRGAMGSSWNAAHPSQGCAMENLEASGGAGLFYCFAID